MAYHRPTTAQVTNDQLWKLNALASFEIMISNWIISNMISKISNLFVQASQCCPEVLFQTCAKYVQINYEHLSALSKEVKKRKKTELKQKTCQLLPEYILIHMAFSEAILLRVWP